MLNAMLFIRYSFALPLMLPENGVAVTVHLEY